MFQTFQKEARESYSELAGAFSRASAIGRDADLGYPGGCHLTFKSIGQ
jgi:hypothetical protein